ncbi:Imm50 family immunity protein [Aurantimonas sp. 22II-16-19i]|uniref:Imm50 family immunity protein n=1 Tax=Aurantimonas sp. 22II-16-19i TaxID=1317114 RepID=UPI0009FA99F5|nr:Imm50 family immunity protein [Aurantimonas sp. 22II-16-19i]
MVNGSDAAIYHEVPGGPELLQWFGQVPNFHDAEILSLELQRKKPSILRLHGWTSTAEEDGTYVLDREAVVSFTLYDVMDLQVEGFSHQNVIGSLNLRRATDRAERRGYLSLAPLPGDVEIELEPCFGLDGFIRARAVTIAFVPGAPVDGF